MLRVVQSSLVLFLTVCSLALLRGKYVYTPAPKPCPDTARSSDNAVRIFNSIHSAMRQWGSSLNHNGLNIFPVTIPKGNLFYHGAHRPERPETFEWLAFEIEHSLPFAQSLLPMPPGEGVPGSGPPDKGHQSPPPSNLMIDPLENQPPPGSVAAISIDSTYYPFEGAEDQHPLTAPDEPGPPPNRNDTEPPFVRPPFGPMRGYMHVYRAARPLRLIYLDGMAAAKSNYGTLDAQDHLLLGWPVAPPPDEVGRPGMFREPERAQGLCDLGKEWDVDGFVRMEAGFEIIYCDFAAGAGLDLVSVTASPWGNETGQGVGGYYLDNTAEWHQIRVFEWMRAAAVRYHGMEVGRVQVDWSGMVSPFWYPMNTTNPDPERAELPRIISASDEDWLVMRNRLGEVVEDRKGKAADAVNWQAVVDNIISRYSHRLQIMANWNGSANGMRSELSTLLDVFIDYRTEDVIESATSRCRNHYLSAAQAQKATWTPEDEAIHAAVDSVSLAVCSGLFNMRTVLFNSAKNGSDGAERTATKAACGIAKDMMDRFRWTTWKDSGGCPDSSQLRMVPMFPLGSKEDIISPKCKEAGEIMVGDYWRDGMQ